MAIRRLILTALGIIVMSGNAVHAERSSVHNFAAYTFGTHNIAAPEIAGLRTYIGPGRGIPRVVNADLIVDGFLNEAVWTRAELYSGFYQSRPFDDRPAQDSTQVYVWYSPTAIYFGVRAYSPKGSVRATLADRDKIQGDDTIQILLDTFNDRRQAYMFAANPLGQQADGVVRDSPGGSTFLLDNNPDFVYESSGRLTEFGYELEFRVPFKSLRFQSESVQDWGLNVVRVSQYSGYESTMTRVLQSQTSFLKQSATITGLTDLRRGIVLDVTPEITSSANRTRDASSFSTNTTDPLGLNVRWGASNNLTLNGTFNPDFSQVEADIAQIVYDPRQAVFFPEKRPYFLDGIELFGSPTSLVYTRRIANPLSSIKLTGKSGKTNIGILSAIDNDALSISDLDPTYYNTVRIKYDLKGQNNVGVTYTDKTETNHSNRVAALDGRFFFSDYYSLTWQTGLSITRNLGESRTGPMWFLSAAANSENYTASISSSGFHNDFRAESGFISRTGIAKVSATGSRKFFGNAGDMLENYSLGMLVDLTWDYDRFTDGKGANDRKLHFLTSYTLKGGWTGRTRLYYESFRYPPALFSNYFIERQVDGVPVDTVAFSGTDRLTNLGFISSLQTPRWKQFSLATTIIYGRDDNFFEWSPADIFFVTLTLNFNPTEQLRFNLLYTQQQYIRANDNSTVGNHRFPRLKIEYQISPSLFVRVVGQYDSNFVDDLRDNSRTENPILIWHPDSQSFSRAVSRRTNLLRADWLLSYRPTPGTVLFIGYGTGMTETNSFRFNNLRRQSDGFFVKLSYLLRV